MRLSAFILANMEPILRDWEDFARSLGDITSSMDAAALRDHAELILQAVAADMETAQSPAQQKAKSLGKAPARPAHLPESAATSHGGVRAAEGFSLAQMVSEYRALRASVLRRWAEVQSTPDTDSYRELMRFNEAIDEALADSIQTYSHAVDQMVVSKGRHRMEMLGTVSAGLGHDMANVLMPMRVCLETLTDKRLPPESVPVVDALRRAVAHLGGLADGLRALSMDPENAASPDSTALHGWWVSAISPFTWALPKGVRLHAGSLDSDAAKALPPVRIPAHVLMQAVFNLVLNAGQAIGKREAASPRHAGRADADEPIGNIWITADLEPASPSYGGPRAVRLTVRDDGPGMDESTAARCTEAFFTTKTRSLGTGLGLYLVRTAVERHGGRLLVESKIGEGTSFTLLLPTTAAVQRPG
ncbi:MAG TPA: sensor histidine kinase [Phycisphaerales bacterium]|nr:sensor histidine kinase [Phycisphaerales bacterium]